MEETSLYDLSNVTLVEGTENRGSGTIALTNMRISWQSLNGYAREWSYQAVLIHAISRDNQVAEKPCIYAQLKGELEDQLLEIRFIPPKEEQVNELFGAFSQGAQLNPDPVQEDEGDFFFNEDEINHSFEGEPPQQNPNNIQDNSLPLQPVPSGDIFVNAIPTTDTNQYNEANGQFDDVDMEDNNNDNDANAPDTMQQ